MKLTSIELPQRPSQSALDEYQFNIELDGEVIGIIGMKHFSRREIERNPKRHMHDKEGWNRNLFCTPEMWQKAQAKNAFKDKKNYESTLFGLHDIHLRSKGKTEVDIEIKPVLD